MRAYLLPLLLVLTAATTPAELERWKSEAQRVTIVRDDWGIAHVSGPTDADAVFGMIYAQAEDDFPRIEANYLTTLGRMAEAEGEEAIWQDLRARLYVNDEKLRADYARSPDWLKRLMNAWADGLNYYLETHPEVRPRVITRFEPWMALSFTEGSIGGDIERIKLDELRDFYSARGGSKPVAEARIDALEHQNSNGIAIAPKITAPGTGALLLINPHTSFFFRSELQMTSGEGLNAYGAATWGQFFIYQGFNQDAGWMHTSSGVDVVDEFAYEVQLPELGPRYRYGSQWRVMEQRPVTIRYRKPDGSFGTRSFTTYHTHRGPIVRSEMTSTCAPPPRKDQRICWIAFAMMDRPVEALQQSYLRTKAQDLATFMKVSDFKANSSNNTIFASSKGEIAYLHPQFVPVRDDRFDYEKPVDGGDPQTDWKGLTPVDRLPNAINPPNGWVDNNNNHPWSTAGTYSPKAADFPKYMDMFGENYRGLHALQMLEGSSGWTADKLNAAAFDNYQPGFAALIPPLIRAYDALAKADPRRAQLAEPVALLRKWDYRWSGKSEAQSLAMFWGRKLYAGLKADPGEVTNKKYMRLARDTSAAEKLGALADAVEWLRRDFGRWQVPWAEINRFQRISPAIDHPFDDSAPSFPVPFADGNFGSLAAFKSDPRKGSKKWYGYHGNSFVAIVEFGPRVSARAVKVGGQSGHMNSRHFTDQAQLYASGALREVYFYPDQLKGHTERVYNPGE
jgi:acyl-homoserine-lactone acylase